MRIAVNASIVDHLLSGLGVYAVNLIKELAKLHDDLVVYTSYPEVCSVDLTKVRRISRRVQPSFGPKGHFQRVFWVQTALPLRLLVDKASLLLSPLPEGMLLPVVPQVVTVLDMIPLHFPEEYPRQQYYFRYLVPRILKKSRRIVTISENTKHDIMTFYAIEPERIHVIPPGFEKSRYRPGINSESVKMKYGLADYLLYVGNLLAHKNLRRLLRAFSLIARKTPYKLVIAGYKDSRYYPELETEVEALGLAEEVLFLDYVSADELPALYAGAKVFVYPSLDEGFGVPPVEAMACGCPAVVSNVASLPEVCGDAAQYIDPYNIENIAGGIHKVLTDEALRQSLIEKGIERAKLFSWEKSAKEHIKIFEEVLSS
jgi:glycosyltransferase involved in cell wall biosynthesis